MAKVSCTEFELVCEKTGKALVVIKPANDGAGIWIEGPDGRTVAVYSIKGQVGVGIYSKKSMRDANGMPIGLTLDENGNGLIQIRKGDEVKHVGFDDL